MIGISTVGYRWRTVVSDTSGSPIVKTLQSHKFKCYSSGGKYINWWKKVKVLLTKSYPSLCNLMDYSPLGSSVHGILHGKNTGVGGHSLLQGIFPTQESNLGLLHCRQMLYHLSHQGNTHLFSFFRGFPLCEDFIFYLATLLFVNIPVFHLSDFKMLLWHSCTFLLDICLGVDMHMSSFIRYGEILSISSPISWY